MKIVEQKNIGAFDYVRYDLGDGASSTKKMGIVRPVGETSSPLATLYLFHGGTGDDTPPVSEGFFSSLNSATVDAIRAQGLQIVLPYIGTSFLHDSVDAAGMNYAAFFSQEVMPAAEKSAPLTSAKRLIAGVSMGGFAALSAFFKAPELYAGVGTLAPALFDLNFFDAGAVDAYIRKSGAVAGYMDHMTSGVKAVFRDNEDFRGASPNVLAELIPYSRYRGRKIYLNVGDQDEFGLGQGVAALSHTLFKRDLAHEVVVVPGAKHDMAYANSQFQPLMQALLKMLN